MAFVMIIRSWVSLKSLFELLWKLFLLGFLRFAWASANIWSFFSRSLFPFLSSLLSLHYSKTSPRTQLAKIYCKTSLRPMCFSSILLVERKHTANFGLQIFSMVFFPSIIYYWKQKQKCIRTLSFYSTGKITREKIITCMLSPFNCRLTN